MAFRILKVTSEFTRQDGEEVIIKNVFLEQRSNSFYPKWLKNEFFDELPVINNEIKETTKGKIIQQKS